MAVAEQYRTGWRLLGSHNVPFVPHREPAVPSFQDLHRRPGLAGAFRTWQQLQGMQLESHRVVLGHLSAVFEAQNLVQPQLRIQRPECRLRVLRRDLEAPVESRQELLQHPVGCPAAARPRPAGVQLPTGPETFPPFAPPSPWPGVSGRISSVSPVPPWPG